jgi:hypothetical protein
MQQLNEVTIFDVNIDTPGVYKIYLLSGNEPIHISRMCGIDQTGLLYIGSSKHSVAYRLKCFLRSMSKERRQNNHSAGVKVLNSQVLRAFIGQGKLHFECRITMNETAHDEEIKEIKDYREKFGEVPPLNG